MIAENEPPISLKQWTSGPDTETLSRRLASGEEKPFLDLLEFTFDRLYRKIHIMLGRKTDAEDALQEILLRAFQARFQYRGGNPVVWLFRISHRYCLDLLRKHQRTPGQEPLTDPPELASPGPPPDAGFPDFLQRLTPTEREVFLLRAVEGMTYSEISAVTGLAEGTLRNLVSGVLHNLLMGCEGFQKWLMEADPLPSDPDRPSDFREHLQGCPACAAEWDKFAAVREQAAGLFPATQDRARIMRMFQPRLEQAAQPIRPRVFSDWPFPLSIITACGMAILFLSLVFSHEEKPAFIKVQAPSLGSHLFGFAEVWRNERRITAEGASEGVQLLGNDRICLLGSSCQVLLSEGSEVRLTGSGSLNFLNGAMMVKGALRARIAFHLKKPSFRVNLPSVTLKIKGTIIHLAVGPLSEEVWVEEGEVAWEQSIVSWKGNLRAGEGLRIGKGVTSTLSHSPLDPVEPKAPSGSTPAALIAPVAPTSLGLPSTVTDQDRH